MSDANEYTYSLEAEISYLRAALAEAQAKIAATTSFIQINRIHVTGHAEGVDCALCDALTILKGTFAQREMAAFQDRLNEVAAETLERAGKEIDSLNGQLAEAQAKITAARIELLNDGPDHTAGHSECTSCRVFAILEGTKE